MAIFILVNVLNRSLIGDRSTEGENMIELLQCLLMKFKLRKNNKYNHCQKFLRNSMMELF